MPTPGPLELVIILVIALIILGPGKLPNVGASLGKSIKEFRKASSDVQEAVTPQRRHVAVASRPRLRRPPRRPPRLPRPPLSPLRSPLHPHSGRGWQPRSLRPLLPRRPSRRPWQLRPPSRPASQASRAPFS